MTKNDLKYGNVVELRQGNKYLYNIIYKHKLISFNGMGFINIEGYNNDLSQKEEIYDFDIIKVYKDYTLKELLWERKETPHLTEDEKVILRNIEKKYKWIARDEDGSLCAYESKPKKTNFFWFAEFYGHLCYSHLFQFIKWEDEEPLLIEDLLKNN